MPPATVDPSIDDPKHIQTCSSETVYLLIKQDDRWVFPTAPVRNLRTFMDTRNTILFRLSQKQKWKVPASILIA